MFIGSLLVRICNSNKAGIFVLFIYVYPKDLEQYLAKTRLSNTVCGINLEHFEGKIQMESVPWMEFDWICRSI